MIHRHEATRPELETIVAEQAASDGIDRRAIDYRFALKDHLTRDEWMCVFHSRN